MMKVRSVFPVRLFLTRDKLLKSMVIVLVYALGVPRLRGDFTELATRILTLKKRSGTKALVNYLKECSRCCVFWMANSEYVPLVYIKISRSGLPSIIPAPLRYEISLIKKGCHTSEGWVIYRGVLTMLQVWRVMKVKGVAPKWETITGPFTGQDYRINSDSVSNLLPHVCDKGKTGKWPILETSGPNTPLATWGLFLDAIAFWSNPRVAVHYVVFAFKQREYFVLSVFVWTMFIGIPWAILLHLMRYPLYIGRISTFEEGGGKVRMIGVTDGWSQILLHRVHKGIYATLRRIPTDGTFDQTKPLLILMDYVRLSGATTYSLDLSAATDRLPILTQVEALASLGMKNTKEWARLLSDREWKSDIGFIRYSVGQAMGAYSSWAALALTHHVIVQVAAYNVGWRTFFPYYALLGDDIVIANKQVAVEYLALMAKLGVEINMTKSIVSSNGTVEFAKRWIHPHLGEFSPIGAKLLLGIVKNITMYPALVVEMIQKSFTLYPSSVKTLLTGLYKIRKPKGDRLYNELMFAAMAPGSYLKHGLMITEWLNMWVTDALGMDKDLFLASIMRSAEYWMRQVQSSQDLPKENWKYFKKNFLFTPVLPKEKLLSWCLMPTLLFSPPAWLYARRLREALGKPFSASVNLYGLFNPESAHLPGALSFSAITDFSDLYSIDWSKRGIVSKHTLALSSFTREMNKSVKLVLLEREEECKAMRVILYEPPRLSLMSSERD